MSPFSHRVKLLGLHKMFLQADPAHPLMTWLEKHQNVENQRLCPIKWVSDLQFCSCPWFVETGDNRGVIYAVWGTGRDCPESFCAFLKTKHCHSWPVNGTKIENPYCGNDLYPYITCIFQMPQIQWRIRDFEMWLNRVSSTMVWPYIYSIYEKNQKLT